MKTKVYKGILEDEALQLASKEFGISEDDLVVKVENDEVEVTVGIDGIEKGRQYIQSILKANDVDETVPQVTINIQATGSTEPPKIKTCEIKFEGLEQELIIFFKKVLSNNASISAAQYHKDNKLGYRLDHWLFAVGAYYEDQTNERKKYFNTPNYRGIYLYEEQQIGNKILQDIELSRNQKIFNKK
jgi:hypothetical protein